MTQKTPLLCIGGAHWDIIAQADRVMVLHDDVPGRVRRLIGGVAGPIAIKLASYGEPVCLLAHAGQDELGEALINSLNALGVDPSFMHRAPHLPTDVYVGIEAPNGLIAAISDATSLEMSGEALLAPIRDGRICTQNTWQGTAIIDSNLSAETLAKIAQSREFSQADLRLVPASPGKVDRLRPFLKEHNAMFYLNLHEARLLLNTDFSDAQTAAQAVIAAGANRVVLTHGENPSAYADQTMLITATPPKVTPILVTGAGDSLTAAHIHADRIGLSAQEALHFANRAAAAHITGQSQ